MEKNDIKVTNTLFKRLIILLFVVLLLVIPQIIIYYNNINNISTETDNKKFVSKYDGSLGTAGYIGGNSIIVSIFADDLYTDWDFNNNDDINTIDDTYDNLRIATDYLSNNIKRYNEKSSFIYDWKKDIDLKYVVSFDENMILNDFSKYDVQKEFIEENIDSERLKERYRADDIIYIFFFNTDESYDVHPCTLGYNSGEEYDIEFINLYVQYDYGY